MFIGIDPGKKGAMVILTESKPIIYTVPLIGDKVDWKQWANCFKTIENMDRDALVVLEEVHSIYGSSAKSNFTFGGMFYSPMLLLNYIGITYELVAPKKWQKQIWSSTDSVYVGGKLDTKLTSLSCAQRLFPDQNFLYGDNENKSGRKSKPHDGIVDAFLLAEYGRRLRNIRKQGLKELAEEAQNLKLGYE